MIIGITTELFDLGSGDKFVDGKGHGFLQVFQCFEQAVFQLSFDAPPDLFRRIEFGCVRRQKQRPDIGRPAELFGCVKGGIVQQHDFELLGTVKGKGIEESLHVFGVAMRHLQHKMPAVHRRKSAIQVGGFKAVLKAAQRPDAFGRKGTVGEGQQAEAAFVHSIQVELRKAPVLLFALQDFPG